MLVSAEVALGVPALRITEAGCFREAQMTQRAKGFPEFRGSLISCSEPDVARTAATFCRLASLDLDSPRCSHEIAISGGRGIPPRWNQLFSN
jgi:hypothetical protein